MRVTDLPSPRDFLLREGADHIAKYVCDFLVHLPTPPAHLRATQYSSGSSPAYLDCIQANVTRGFRQTPVRVPSQPILCLNLTITLTLIFVPQPQLLIRFSTLTHTLAAASMSASEKPAAGFICDAPDRAWFASRAAMRCSSAWACLHVQSHTDQHMS